MALPSPAPTCRRAALHAGACSAYEERRGPPESALLARVRAWEQRAGFVTPLRWRDITVIALWHAAAVGWLLYNLLQGIYPKWQTVAFWYLIGALAGFGVTGGVHRYWCHRSYKAKMPLQIILMLCYSVAGQNSIYKWVRDHRVHHKFSETDADPHDARRGLFFSHMGWLMMKQHPASLRASAAVDMSDITGDPLVQFHTKYFTLLKLALCFVAPTLVPVLAWGERWDWAVLSQPLLRYLISLHFTWSVNSFAHFWGNKPYDRYIKPSENWFVSLMALGEGWHNYHHSFPWDYRASELGYCLNPTMLLLDMFARVGWAYDLKQASPALVRAVASSRGDRSAAPHGTFIGSDYSQVGDSSEKFIKRF